MMNIVCMMNAIGRAKGTVVTMHGWVIRRKGSISEWEVICNGGGCSLGMTEGNLT